MSLGKILVVDDDKNICELLRLYLEKEGYNVILSHDGSEAVVKFNALDRISFCWISCFPAWTDGRSAGKSAKNQMWPIIMLTAKGETFEQSSRP